MGRLSPRRGSSARVVMAVVGALVAAPLAAAPARAAEDVRRIGGATRYDTAAEVWRQNRAVFAGTTTAVLTRGDHFADALAAAPLAAALKSPLLTTASGALSPAASRALAEAKVNRVYIVGGTGAVGPAVEARLKAAGITVKRIWGPDRFATAREVGLVIRSVRGKAPLTTFVASGMTYPDALSAGAAAGAAGGIVLLSRDKELDDETVSYLDSGLVGRIYGVGGAASAALWDNGFGHIPVVGADRFQTSADLAARVFPNATSAVVTSGMMYADALPGGVLAAMNKGPLLLTSTATLDPTTATYLAHVRPRVDVLGGTGAVSSGVEAATLTARGGAVPVLTGAAPRIVTDTQDVYGLVAGEGLRLTAYAVGDRVTYQWFHKTPGGVAAAVPGATGPTYIKAAAEPSDSGSYWAEIRSASGTTSSEPSMVHVSATRLPATITAAPTAKVGAVYTVRATGGMARSYPAIVEEGATTLEGLVTKGDYLTGQVAFQPYPEEAGQRYEVVMVSEDGVIESETPRVSLTVVK